MLNEGSLSMVNTPTNIQLGQLQLPDILEGFDHPAVLLGADYRILATNHRYQKRFSSTQKLEGNTCFRVSHGYDRPCDQFGEQCPLHDCRASGEPRRVLHLHHTHHGRIHEEVSIFPIRNAAGKLACYIEILTEVQLAQTESTFFETILDYMPFYKCILVRHQSDQSQGILVHNRHKTCTNNHP